MLSIGESERTKWRWLHVSEEQGAGGGEKNVGEVEATGWGAQKTN